MRNIYLVENYQLSIKEAYTNLKKAVNEYNYKYFNVYGHIRRHGIYRYNDYVITKIEVK